MRHPFCVGNHQQRTVFGGVDGERYSVANLETHIGVFDPGTYDETGRLVDDGSGHRDFWNIVETIRREFAAKNPIDKRFMLVEGSFEAEMLEEQIYPYWEGFCKTKWYVAFPQPNPDPRNF